MRLACTVVAGDDSVDVLVDCKDDTPARELRTALRDLLPPTSLTGEDWSLIAGEDATVADLRLRNGEVIRFGGAGRTTESTPTSGLQLHVVGGPCSGLLLPLGNGTHELGRAGTLSWPDHSMSRRHCRVVVTPGGLSVSDLDSANGTRIEGTPLPPGATRPWLFGQTLEIGDSVLLARRVVREPLAVEVPEPGWRYVHRRLRRRRPEPPTSIEVPPAPTPPPTSRALRLLALLPIPVGIAAALLLQSWLLLLVGLAAPVLLGVVHLVELQGPLRAHRTALAHHRAQLLEAQNKLAAVIAEEQVWLREASPDAAELQRAALGPGPRLWERTTDDPAFGCVRVGTGSLAARVRIVGGTTPTTPRTHAVPVTLDLAADGVVGLAGPDAEVDASLRWWVAQLAALHAPGDLSLTFLTATASRRWSWVPWLPHLHPADGDPAIARFAVAADAEDLVAELTTLVRERDALLAQRPDQGFRPHVVVCHDHHRLRAVRGLGDLLEHGPRVGIQLICTDRAVADLPAACTSVVEVGTSAEATLRRGEEEISFLREGVGSGWADRVARALAPLRDAGNAPRPERSPRHRREAVRAEALATLAAEAAGGEWPGAEVMTRVRDHAATRPSPYVRRLSWSTGTVATEGA